MEKVILHAGCGQTPLPAWLSGREVRLDIDPRHKPDIVASLTSLGNIGPFDGIFCSHCLEHLHPYEGAWAMREFIRVLKPGGAAMIMVPNLEHARPTEDVVYISDAGPITGLDMIYGMREYSATMPYMMHKNGFIEDTLASMLRRAGFPNPRITKDHINLFAVAIK